MSLEQQLAALAAAVTQQAAAITRQADAMARQNELLSVLVERVDNIGRRQDWNDAQVAQLLRVIATSMREIRETQVYGLLADGPVTAEALRHLMQRSTRDQMEPVLVFESDGVSPPPPPQR